jgi:hypothetical protein
VNHPWQCRQIKKQEAKRKRLTRNAKLQQLVIGQQVSNAPTAVRMVQKKLPFEHVPDVE